MRFWVGLTDWDWFDYLATLPVVDEVIEVRQSVLDEEDGPMLRHGLQGMHMQSIVLPKSVTLQPDRNRLYARYEFFRSLR